MANEKLTWLLELEAKLDGAIKLSRELQKVEHGLNAVDEGLKKTEASTDSASGKADKAAGAFGRMGEVMKSAVGHFVGELGADLFRGAVNMARQFAGEVVHAAEESEKLKISFDLLVGQAEREVQFDWLERLAQQIPGTGDDLKALERQLLAVGIPLTSMRATLAGAMDLSVITGKPIEMVVQGLGEIVRSGGSAGRVMRMLGLSEEKAFTALAKANRTTVDNVKQLLDAGQLTGMDALRSVMHSVADMQGGELGGAALKGGATLGERIKDMKDSWEDLFKEGVEHVAPSISKAFASITQQFRGGDLGERMSKAIETIATTLANIDWEKGALRFVGILEKGLGLVDKIAGFLGVESNTENGAAKTIERKVATSEASPRGIADSILPPGMVGGRNLLPSMSGAATVVEPRDAAEAVDNFEFHAKKRAVGNAFRGLGRKIGLDLPDEAPSEFETFLRDTADKMKAKERPTPAAQRSSSLDVVESAGASTGKADRTGSAVQPIIIEDRTAQRSAADRFERQALVPMVITNEPGAARRAGNEAGDGYAIGVLEKMSAAEKAGNDLGRATLDGARSALDAHSPSRKFAELGRGSTEGYAAGMESQADRVDAAARETVMPSILLEREEVADAPVFSAPAPAAAFRPTEGIGGRKVEINIPVTITIDGSRGAEGADEAVARLAATLPGALQGPLERLAIEAGV